VRSADAHDACRRVELERVAVAVARVAPSTLTSAGMPSSRAMIAP
jgi:hypothetical protein